MILSYVLSVLWLLIACGSFGLVVYLAWLFIRAAKPTWGSIPPYIQGKPEVTFKGPVRNRMRHVLSF